MSPPRFLRRARPALGTLAEVGLRVPEEVEAGSAARWAEPLFRLAWRALAAVERTMSAFDAGSDVGRFNRARRGDSIPVGAETAGVLRAARWLERGSAGLFDVSLGTGPDAWSLRRREGAAFLRKHAGAVRLDLGGLAKGHAVDRAFEALASRLRGHRGMAWWVNAGGDLRVHGVRLPVLLRDERGGGARPWLELCDGALATSHYGPAARSRLSGADPAGERHVSVVSPRCLWSDGLTKVVALSGRPDHPLLARRGAVAWLHPVRHP
ncbi:MAG TPA: FAD:protein FMN transferase [Anaeromyxobacteraceae bacterium]|nr:FAD:protein FMN transferase [Anaeromyxobacteraceae bacterium]